MFGGSFNPPHVAHAMVSAWLLWTDAVDAVWLVPVFRHAFEDIHDKTLAPYDERVRWCQAMARDVGPSVQVSTIERDLPVPSYSIDTLQALAALHPEHRFRMVIGTDVIPQLPQWHNWEQIEAEFDPSVVGRAGFTSPQGVQSPDFPQISSTDIRKRLQEKRPVGHLLTRSVVPLVSAAFFK